MVRSGDEPMNARSPLRLRLGLALGGMLVTSGGAAGFAMADRLVAAAVCAAGTLLSAGDAVMAGHRIRQGPHYQPGPDVPPYHPVPSSEPGPSRRSGPPPNRQRLYLIMMGTCLALISSAWIWVRLVSVPAAVAMSVVAMVIPPIAAVVANAGWDRPSPGEGSREPRPQDDPGRTRHGDRRP
jgi:hypothetical protein